MFKAREFLKKTITNIPSWTDTKKRTSTSVSGKYLDSISEEQNSIYDFFEEYKKEFFIMNYIGKEETILSKAVFALVGDIPLDTKLLNTELKITTEYKEFVLNTNKYTLYQEGLLAFDPKHFKKQFLKYSFRNYEYSEPTFEDDIWNIFDEFALFSSLERYKDETNRELLKRTVASFKNPTNSTRDGLKNTIINTLINKIKLNKDDIKITTPLEENLLELNEGEDVYEDISTINKDIFRKKIWDMSAWEHKFKTMWFIPHLWDKKLDTYQKGTGQNKDLEVKLSSEIDEELGTNVYVTAYKKSPALINGYIRRQGIKKKIPIQLKKYNNEIRPQLVEYKITATELKELDSKNIFIKALKSNNGQSDFYLEDIILDKDNLTEFNKSSLEPNNTYRIEFKPKDNDSIIEIYNADLVNSNNKTSLLKENSNYGFNNKIFKNKNIIKHATKLIDLKTFNNVKENEGSGFTIGNNASFCELSLDVTNIADKHVIIKKNCPLIDYTSEPAFVKTKGFTLKDSYSLISDKDAKENSVIVELTCTQIYIEFGAADDPSQQGSASVKFEINDEINEEHTGIWSDRRIVNMSFKELTKVRIEITKIGLYPIEVKNIKASRYKFKTWLDHGTLTYSGNDIILPRDNITENYKSNSLHVYMENLSGYSPVIDYIHIGNNQPTQSYIIDNINIKDSNTKLDINHNDNCSMILYKVSGNNLTLMDTNYSTKKSYRNNTSEAITIPINTDNFIEINQSSIPITKETYKGHSAHCITLNPGDSFNKLTINGYTLIPKAKLSIAKLLNKKETEKIYISNNINGFIKTENNRDYDLVKINKDDLIQDADIFQYEGNLKDITTNFVIDYDNQIVSNKTNIDKQFEYTYLSINNSGHDNYVAYNQSVLVSSPHRTKLINTFSPLLDLNKLMLYTISDITSETLEVQNISCNFVVNNKLKSQCISQANTEIEISYPFTDNTKNNCKYTIENLNEEFLLSNTVALKPYFNINNKQEPIGRYIVIPPKDMSVNYNKEATNEYIIPENDLFNKLYYSNIVNVLWIKDLTDNNTIDSSKYTLMNEEGIIVWKDKSLVGKNLQIFYSYNVPSSLSFNDLQFLYDTVENSTDAYKIINKVPYIIKNLKDGQSKSIPLFDETPDKIVTKCSNANYEAISDNNNITVRKISNSNNLLIHSGYYYDYDKEYYMFQNQFKETTNRLKNLDLHNVTIFNDTLQCAEETSNFLKNSSMKIRNREQVLCHIDTVKHENRIKQSNYLENITACESLQSWVTFNMTVSLDEGLNGMGLKFSPEKSLSYAILDISNYVAPNRIISLYNKNLKISLLREIKIEDYKLRKSIFAEPYMDFNTYQNSEYNYFYFNKDTDTTYNYYILVKGEGTIDDILIKDLDIDIKEISSINPKLVHTKNIDILNYKVTEENYENQEIELEFDKNNNLYKGLQLAKDNTLSTGTNTDYGLTLIANMTPLFSEFGTQQCDLVNNKFYSKSGNGVIKSPPISLSNLKSISTLYVKVNDVLIENAKYLNIKVLTSKYSDGDYYQIGYKKKTNYIAIDQNELKSYIQIVVELESNKVINNIEVYAKYAELGENSPRISNIESGYLTTKIYDTLNSGTYKLNKINLTSNQDHNAYDFEIRACRYNSSNNDLVWTRWYYIKLDENNNTIDPHIFEDYRYFQFKVILKNPEIKVKIKDFVFQVV